MEACLKSASANRLSPLHSGETLPPVFLLPHCSSSDVDCHGIPSPVILYEYALKMNMIFFKCSMNCNVVLFYTVSPSDASNELWTAVREGVASGFSLSDFSPPLHRLSL